MELKYVKEFVSLAETGSYFETAEQLFIATSSLSRHIKALEEELGLPLFDRSTRKVVLNRNGNLFLPYAKELVRIDEECAKAFQEEATRTKGTLNIGSIPMLKAYKINEILHQFSQEQPDIMVNMHEADSVHLVQLLKSSELDFAFIRNRNVSVEEFENLPIAQDHLVAIVPKSHPLASKASVSIGELRNESLLLISQNSFMYRLCTDLCKAEGFQPRVVFTSQRAENLMDLVAQGTGIALLMAKPIEPIIPEDMVMVDIEPRITTTVFVVYMKNHKLNSAGKLFLDLCQKVSMSSEA